MPLDLNLCERRSIDIREFPQIKFEINLIFCQVGIKRVGAGRKINSIHHLIHWLSLTAKAVYPNTENSSKCQALFQVLP